MQSRVGCICPGMGPGYHGSHGLSGQQPCPKQKADAITGLLNYDGLSSASDNGRVDETCKLNEETGMEPTTVTTLAKTKYKGSANNKGKGKKMLKAERRKMKMCSSGGPATSQITARRGDTSAPSRPCMSSNPLTPRHLVKVTSFDSARRGHKHRTCDHTVLGGNDISFISSQKLDHKAARIQTQAFREEDNEGAKSLGPEYYSPVSSNGLLHISRKIQLCYSGLRLGEGMNSPETLCWSKRGKWSWNFQ